MLRKFVKENKQNKNGSNNGVGPSMTSQYAWGSGFFSNKGGHFAGQGIGVSNGSYAHGYQPPLPQKPSEDEIDKYFAKDNDESS